MNNIGVQELKQIQVDMLKEIDKYCKKHNLRYSLAFGSLLGAVRHKGFIPWDDDLGISCCCVKITTNSLRVSNMSIIQ